MVVVLIFLEQKFNIKILDSTSDNFNSVNNMVELVKNYINLEIKK